MVLIVEDDEDSRYLMRLELERLGYLIVEAENGEKAVEVAQRERPDIVLMDLTLPIMDGIAAAEQIRATDGLSSIPIIAVTAHQETDFRKGAAAAGFDAVRESCPRLMSGALELQDDTLGDWLASVRSEREARDVWLSNWEAQNA